MDADIQARGRLIEQIRKETLDKIRQYQVGWIHNGEMIATKSSGLWSGFLFVIPDAEYKELFKEG